MSKNNTLISLLGCLVLVFIAFVIGIVLGINVSSGKYNNLTDIERSRQVEEYLNKNFSQENDVTYLVKIRNAHGEIIDSDPRIWRKYKEGQEMTNVEVIHNLHKKFDYITEALIKNLDEIAD